MAEERSCKNCKESGMKNTICILNVILFWQSDMDAEIVGRYCCPLWQPREE